MADPIAELIATYHELNSNVVQELTEEPSPLEFMRHVARNTPFVVRQGASSWPAVKQWSAAYLREALAGHPVNVAVTPCGNADAPTVLVGEDGKDRLVFAKPLEETQPFEQLLDYVAGQQLDPENVEFDEIRYAQTQNDNLRHEYVSLFSQVQRAVPFARIALQNDPDAINMWVGNSRSVTAMHKDNYENIYVQIRGQKHFVLLPPLCQPCVNEQELVPATYVRDQATTTGTEGQSAAPLRLEVEEDGDKVPFAIWDPDQPADHATTYSGLAAPMRVTLDPGDMLYLPAMWYHKVSQSCAEDGICVAVNYWYDMEFSGPQYPLASFVRNVNHQSIRSTSA
ncbi:phospholipase A2 [Microdochium trichocladiopsis]|uniref:Phospholipase A2 n=1 Tax=Microdochium trichocladiopsis TaxID=1682393 RepID=A0A9P8Y9M0_9PEZI|nr:phospholipase A2 [Microdochium trichocladiopsis]KAH7033231.1 phospholipase A2 [Microdochium trichocladiopsis]